MKIGLCCIAKKENDYIREFIEYYKKLGVDHIFLYDNNDDIDSHCMERIVKGNLQEEHFEDVIGDYIEEKFVEVINFRNKKICQLEAYQDCYERNKIEYDWLMFFDCDEFLTLNDKETNILKSYLNTKRFQYYQIIHINMCIYDDNDLLENDGRGVLERFTRKAEGKYASFNNGIKSIVRGGLTDIKWISTPHTPISPYSVCDGLGNKVEGNSPFNTPNTNGAYLKHFKCKTITEYIMNKMGKGSYPDQSDASAMAHLTIEDFFKHNIRTQEKEAIANELIKTIEQQLYVEAHIICFNEIKLVPFAMQYWKRNFNHIYIYDNGSTDGTIELLKTLPNVTVYHFNSNNEFNDAINIQIKNNCWKNSEADFVVVSDFDEFIYSPDLRKELQYMKDHKMSIARLNGYDMVCYNFPEYDETKLTIETIQMGMLNEMMCKPILFNPKAMKHVNLCCGAHFCNPVGDVKWYDRNKIFLLHHKFLSLPYMTDRYTYLQKRLSQTNIQAQMGMQYFWDEEKKKKEFEFVKACAINVWEYVNTNIPKATETICLSIINGDFNHMLYQIVNGLGIADKMNKDFYVYANTKEAFETFNMYRSTIFKNIRCVDNPNLLIPRNYKKIYNLSHDIEQIDENILVNIDEEKFFIKPNDIINKLNITDELINNIKTAYNTVNFDNSIALYIKKHDYPNDIKELLSNTTRTETVFVISDDIKYEKEFLKGITNIHYCDLDVNTYPTLVTQLILMILCKNINISVYKNTIMAKYLQDEKRGLN